jgi:hypothetical protein
MLISHCGVCHIPLQPSWLTHCPKCGAEITLPENRYTRSYSTRDGNALFRKSYPLPKPEQPEE